MVFDLFDHRANRLVYRAERENVIYRDSFTGGEVREGVKHMLKGLQPKLIRCISVFVMTACPADVFSFALSNFALAFRPPGNFSKGHNFMSAPAPAQPAAPSALEQVLQLSVGFMVSAALSAVTSLEIPDLLQSGPKNVADLAVSTNSNQDALYRVMRALGTAGIFAETAPRTFSLTSLSELLCKNHPQTLRPMVLWITCGMHFEIFRELGRSVRTGETLPEKVYGLPCFDYLGQNQAVGDLFNNAMTGFSNNAIAATLEAYDFQWLCGKTLVDVAGGHGLVLTEILKKC